MQEVWKPCPQFTTTHEISNLGRVRSVDRVIDTRRGPRVMRGRVLALDYTHANGYARVCLSVGGRCTMRTVHGLVARAFLGRPPGPVGSRRGEYTVDHVDCDKRNNRADNLEWVTSEENRRRAMEGGTIPRGSAHPRSKLTEADVRLLRALYATGEHTLRSLAERFDLGRSQVGNVVRGLAWRHVA